MTTPADAVCYRHTDREAHIRCQRCNRTICPDCMREASVGFQCPGCVSQGAKSVRKPQAAYGGQRSANPALTSLVLMGVNVAVWLGVVATGWQSSSLLSRLALVPKGVCESISDPRSIWTATTERSCALGTDGDGDWVAGVADGSFYQLFTSMFLHVEIWHIAANMLSLWILGPMVESVLGRARFLALYFVSGFSGSVMSYWLHDEFSRGLGASGAIFGLFGALVVLIHKVGGDMRQIVGLLVLNAFITFAVPNISWQAHLGGLLGGAVVTAILAYAPRGRRTQVQALAIGGYVALLALAVVLRTAQLA